MSETTTRPWNAFRLVGADGAPLRGEAAAEYVGTCIRAGGDADFYAIVIDDAGGGKPADVCHTGNGPRSKANAELIVRAVNAHENFAAALRRFVDLHEAEYLGSDPRAAHAVKLAREALESR